jgi:TolA-binding protein
MNTYVLIVALIGGSYWYVTHKVKLDEPLAYTAKHKKESWAPRANYYIGLTYYQRSDYPKAQAAFSQLLIDHATSQFVENSLIYLADSAETQNDWNKVKECLARYVEEYPEGKHIERAKAKLDFVRYKHGP